MVTRSTDDTAAVASARDATREITGALGASVVLLALMLGAVLVADREVVAALGTLALAAALALTVLVSRRARGLAAQRSEALAQERRGRDQLDRTLAATRRLVEIESPVALRREICETARSVFECSAVSLWEVEPENLLLLERVPWQQPYHGGDRRSIASLPGLREALDSSQPLFVADLKTEATGVTRATAEAVGTRSLLHVPVAIEATMRLSLVLSWDEVLPPSTPIQRIAAQRFANQAGLALEQSRYRAAQAEIASLNRTLRRMVQADPLFHAGGTTDEVVRAVCEEGLAVFEASGAALWLDAGEGIELAGRVPEAAVFTPRHRIMFAEHPTFAEDLEAGQPRYVEDVEHGDPVLWERFARHSKSRSQLRLPLASAGQARALVILSWAERVSPPSAEVFAVASRFADQAGVALAEAARREAQREAGELHARFERSLLPLITLDSADASVATFYRPGDARLTLGGDFYDCLELDDGSIVTLIGDVAGHGPAAAALGAGLRSAWRALVLGGWRLEDLPGGLQAVCVRERHDPYLFVTAIIARLEPDRSALRFVSAGHPAPLVAGTHIDVAANGPPLGVVADARWEAVTVPLTPPASVLLYTDGLVEGRAEPNSRDRLGIERIEALVANVEPGRMGEADLRRLVDHAAEANGTGLADDVALLAVNVSS